MTANIAGLQNFKRRTLRPQVRFEATSLELHQRVTIFCWRRPIGDKVDNTCYFVRSLEVLNTNTLSITMTVPNSPALDQTFAALHSELRAVARARISRHPNHLSLQATSLVNDCYIKLRHTPDLKIANRIEFLAYASRAMRSIVIDLAREEHAVRRGGDITIMTLDTVISESLAADNRDVDAIDAALNQLAEVDTTLAELVEMRFFGGLTMEEIAEVRGVRPALAHLYDRP
jgi:RNA polymerase sigma factor (TIGR02999 family)